ncbi:unnamed protein product, partial [marine sediment metagenome]
HKERMLFTKDHLYLSHKERTEEVLELYDELTLRFIHFNNFICLYQMFYLAILKLYNIIVLIYKEYGFS